MKVHFVREKETKNTVRFQEVVENEQVKVGTLYMQKWLVKKLGIETKLVINISKE